MVAAISHKVKPSTKKCFSQQKQFRLIVSEVESHGDENESKKETVKKKRF